MSNLFTHLLNERPFLLADGALGTNLFTMGLQTGDAPELWNIDHPDRIADLAQQFIDAGSDILLTNSFGGTRFRLKLHKAEHRVHELNRAAAQILRQKADICDRDIIVAGSMGPTGEIFAPTGTLTYDEAYSAFKEQAEALKDGGVDVLWIETISASEEAKVAYEAAVSTGLPVVYTMSIDTNGRTMMGVTPDELVQLSAKLGTQFDQPPGACGTNCGVGAAEVVAAIMNMKTSAEQHQLDPVLVAKANCGIPEYVDGKIVYSGTPELMASYARMVADAGARIIGGCCGTTPIHIAAMREALDGYQAGDKPELETLEQVLGAISTGAKAQLNGDLSVAGGSASGGQTRRSRRAPRKAQH
ncbi:betaine--homocysteine S-methyltransferase [Amphritea balenae]|uniref:Betaine--homocysteine S-methyltransferase n=1 Tax=Amphritea balenae TaxID=452629 RepID=A0A3P1SU24_9GAMM|nr:betaine--homocysteine S-methyltransferase [Amphritea balenae]RRD00714.1 betaine--homocysteine S-methyltransferase [Amphritea balenae]GGK68388.1 methionine synthase [Amphritea balenae]